jgi:hypothetical protein
VTDGDPARATIARHLIADKYVENGGKAPRAAQDDTDDPRKPLKTSQSHNDELA